jgi:DNA-binding XRE family transcriptional regulator
MRLSHEERKLRGRLVETVREKCVRGDAKITQEEAARLLGVAKNTWVRWESGEFQPDGLKLELLPYLFRNECPQPCGASRAQKWDVGWMAEHIRICRDCWLAINYLATVAKGCPHKNKFRSTG